MSILLVASFPDSLVNFRGALIDACLARGLAVHVAAPDVPASSPIRHDLEARGVTVHEIPLERTGTDIVADLRLLLHLIGLMRRIRPRRVLGYTVKPVVYGTLAGFVAHVPARYALITGLGFAFQGGARRGPLRSLVMQMYRTALGRAHKVFFQNPDDEALFRQSGLLPAEVPSRVVNGSGVDLVRFAEAPLPEGVRFLLIARLLGDKGVREYVAAARRIRASCPQAVFGLAGWIDDNPDAITRQELDRWIDEGVVEFHGRLEDVRAVIAASNVYVLPSYREGTPRTVLEAMSMGRPIITTDAPGCRQTVVDGENGFLVPVKSVDALEAAMRRFVDQPELIGPMGRRSRAIAVERYDVNEVNAMLLREMGVA